MKQLKITKYQSSEKTGGRPKMLYAVNTEDKDQAIKAVKNMRKMKEEYIAKPGYVAGKDLFWSPKYGKKKVMVVSVV